VLFQALEVKISLEIELTAPFTLKIRSYEYILKRGAGSNHFKRNPLELKIIILCKRGKTTDIGESFYGCMKLS